MYHRSPGTSSLVSEMPLLPSSSLRWRRVLLKVSGEALLGDGSQNIDPKVLLPHFPPYLRTMWAANCVNDHLYLYSSLYTYWWEEYTSCSYVLLVSGCSFELL